MDLDSTTFHALGPSTPEVFMGFSVQQKRHSGTNLRDPGPDTPETEKERHSLGLCLQVKIECQYLG